MSSIIINEDKIIKYLIHISDIHIRNNERTEEYNEVFNMLYQKLDTLKNKKSSIIVLCGDILHSKNSLTPNGVQLFLNFMKNLSKRFPVFLIAGNHDCNLNNKEEIDPLTSLLSLSSNNIWYLKNTGIYQYGNILFYVLKIIILKHYVRLNKNLIIYLKK